MANAKEIVGLVLQISLFLLVMSIAMESTPSRVAEQLRHPKQFWRAVIAVNVVVPLIATLLALALPLVQPVRIGLLLMAISPLAPFVPMNAVKLGARRSSVIALYTSLILIAIVLVPLTLSVLNRVFGASAIAPLALIAKVVFVSALIPLACGLLLSAFAPAFSKRAGPIVQRISLLCVLTVLVLLLWFTGRQLLHMIGNGTILAFTVTTAAGILAGHMLGGPDLENRGALALAASIRHPGIAAAIAEANGADKRAVAAILLFLFNGVIVTSLYQAWLKRRRLAAAAGH